MGDGQIIIRAVKIHRVIQILAVTINDALFESPVPGIGGGHALGAWLEPLLRDHRGRWPRRLLGGKLGQENIEDETSWVGQEEEPNPRVRRQFN